LFTIINADFILFMKMLIVQIRHVSREIHHRLLTLFLRFLGLLHWEKGRKHWLRKKAGSAGEEDKKEEEGEERAAINIDVDEIIDIIFSNRWRVTSPSNSLPGKTTETARGTFAHPVPLPQMVDILVDLWEAEGLDM
jgi:hypothetical protein